MPMLLQITLAVLLASASTATADPQTNLVNRGCSQYNTTNPITFFSNLNASFTDLRASLGTGDGRFATAERARSANPVYTLFQCRGYMSVTDCHTCFTTAISEIRSCGTANGARVTYDGCFLRYESGWFFDQNTQLGNVATCGNKTAAATDFAANVVKLVGQLAAALPRVKGYFAAAEGEGVYAAAQCTEMVTQSGCGDCMRVAVGNVGSCPPATEGRATDAGCFLRYSDKAFFGANQTVDLSSYLHSEGSSKKWAIIGGVVGGVGLLLLGLLLFLWIRRSRKPGQTRRKNLLGATELRGPVNFRYKDLKSATKNFSEKNKLGEGGFGDVYKGVLGNGKIVAVKKLTVSQASRVKLDFETEVTLISNVHHRNLIRLLGCSSKGSEMLLVYEYMVNNSLDKFLFGDKRGSLSWKQRFDIIVGMARGLGYLHHEFHVCIIHRDIKSSNVLLDDDFQPRIADFGLAKLLPGNQSHVSTRFAGTLGYTAPEYALHGKLSEKVDTYSYGVVVLEIISGRKSNDISLEPISQYLLEWAWALFESGTLLELVDTTLDPSEYDPEEVKKIIEIALLCTQSTVAARPSMSEVVVMMLSKTGSVLPPTRPIFIDARTDIPRDTSTSSGTKSSLPSDATVSISEFSAR